MKTTLHRRAWHVPVGALTPAQRRSLRRWLRALWGHLAHLERVTADDMSTPVGMFIEQHYTKAYSEA